MKRFIGLIVIICTLPCTAVAESNDSVEFNAAVGIEYGRDDNVVVEEIDFTSSLGDNFLRLRAKGDVDISLAQDTVLSAGISFNDLQYSDAEAFDLRSVLLSTGLQHKFNDTTIGVDFRRANTELGGVDFLSLTQYSPYISSFISKRHFVRAAYTYYDKTLDDNPLRDATSDELGADYYFFQNGLTRYFIVAAKFRSDDAVDDEFDFDSYQLRLAYKQRYTLGAQKQQFTFDLNYRNRDYDAVINPDIDDFRQDKRTRIRLENVWSATDQFDVVLFFENINNDSNLTSFDFSEKVYSIALNYEF